MFRKIRFLLWKPFSFFHCHRQVAPHWPVAFNQSLSSTGSAIIDGKLSTNGIRAIHAVSPCFLRSQPVLVLCFYRTRNRSICGYFATKKWYKPVRTGFFSYCGSRILIAFCYTTHTNWNCFFRHFNCVNTQIRTLIKLLFILLVETFCETFHSLMAVQTNYILGICIQQ